MNQFIDAAAHAVARTIAELRREADRERELRDAQFAAALAEVGARLAAVADLERQVEARLASLKDGQDGKDGENGADGRDGVDGANGADGVSPSLDEVRAALLPDVVEATSAIVQRIVGEWERPQDGKDADPEVIRSMVQEAVAAIPIPADGQDGRDGIDGKDGDPGPQGERGFGLDDFDTDLIEGGRTLLLKFTRGEVMETHEIPLPVGPKGEDGADGERGPEGPAGSLQAIEEWQDKVYYQGEVVVKDGEVFQASRDTGKAPDHQDWRCIVRKGADGRSFTIRGTWAPEGEYRSLDVVMLNGASFAAKRDDPGDCPGDGWQLLATQGKQGKPGVPGPRGAPGQAVTSSVRAAKLSDDGLLRLVNADGTEVECDLYPVLSKLG